MKNPTLPIPNFLFVLLTLLLLSCEQHVVEEGATEIAFECTPDVSLSTDVRPIIESKCLMCHGGDQIPDLRTTPVIITNAGRIRDEVVSRRMPRVGSLTNEQIALIECWVNNGALDN